MIKTAILFALPACLACVAQAQEHAGHGAHADQQHTRAPGEHGGSHGMLENPRFASLAVPKLEWVEGDAMAWELEAAWGGDLHQVALISEGERSGGNTETAELQLLYRRAIAPFWNLQLGWRHDPLPQPQRGWGVIGINGIAPFHIDTDITLFIGDAGRTALRLEAAYELLLTQRLALVPEIEINIHGRDDADHQRGAGLSDVEAGLRLQYQITPQFAPYAGVTWHRFYGDSGSMAAAAGHAREQHRVVAGVSWWF